MMASADTSYMFGYHLRDLDTDRNVRRSDKDLDNIIMAYETALTYCAEDSMVSASFLSVREAFLSGYNDSASDRDIVDCAFHLIEELT